MGKLGDWNFNKGIERELNKQSERYAEQERARNEEIERVTPEQVEQALFESERFVGKEVNEDNLERYKLIVRKSEILFRTNDSAIRRSFGNVDGTAASELVIIDFAPPVMFIGEGANLVSEMMGLADYFIVTSTEDGDVRMSFVINNILK